MTKRIELNELINRTRLDKELVTEVVNATLDEIY